MKKHFRKMTIAAIAAGMLVLSALVAIAADETDARFERIAIGLTKTAVIAVMGRAPDATISTKTAGFLFERLRWNNSGRVFLVRLVGSQHIESRVVGTKNCVGPTEC